MLERHQKLAIYMEGALLSDFAKMGYGVMRYSPNPVVCVIDSEHAGKDAGELTGIPRHCPVVANVEEAMALGAEAMVLGVAPPGGLIPREWFTAIDEAVEGGLCILNGLHDLLRPLYPSLKPHQWIWDIRVEPAGLSVGTGAAANLPNKRVLMIGTDMNIGKMTAGLELFRVAREHKLKAEFIATGQIGITITGRGVPLDAVRVDFASGSIEREVMRAKESELIIVEGQGALIHPGSTANLPLMRGSCPTHLILCHRANQKTLQRVSEIAIPDLLKYIHLYQDLAEACGTFPRPAIVGIALNTSHLEAAEAWEAVQDLESKTHLPCTDPVRFGPEKLLHSIFEGAARVQ